MSDFDHYRLQCHIEPAALADKPGQGVIASTRTFGPVPTFDLNKCEYTNPLSFALHCYWNAMYHGGLRSKSESESDSDPEEEVQVIKIKKV